MYIIKYFDKKGNEVTDKTNSLVIYSNILRSIKNHLYKIISIVEE